MASQEEYLKLIRPWQVQYDENYKRNYFFNPETSESLWALPPEVSDRVLEFYQEKYEDDFEETNNIVKYIPPEQRMSRDNESVLKRPARKQVEISLAKNYAYKQGDEDYNIWYDKYLTDSRDKEREAAPTRCEPEADAGFTKADKMEKYSTYFCIHFARGCCAEGPNCLYYHRVPTVEECQEIDQAKDIFGRARFAEHREDMEGIGSFLKECRTISVTDFRMPNGNDPIGQMYEVLWRHFSPWGEVEDIHLHPGKGIAFVRYLHRCMAEFAKAAMMNQHLDAEEILIVKWANDDDDPNKEENKTEEQKEKEDKKKNKNKKRRRKDKETKPLIEDKYEAGYGGEEEAGPALNLNSEEEKIIKQKKKEIKNNIGRLASIFNKIDNPEQVEESAFDENGNLKIDLKTPQDPNKYYNNQYGYMNPASNNLPLFGK